MTLSGSLTLNAKAEVLQGSQGLITACTFCFWITFAKLVPLIILILVAVPVAGHILYLPHCILPGDGCSA